MFSIKRSSDPNPTNLDPNTALPNNYGRVRTLKEDFENFKSGRAPSAQEDQGSSIPTPASPVAKTPQAPQQEIVSVMPAKQSPPPQTVSRPETLPKNFQVASSNETEQRPAIPNPFGSETFFQTQSPFAQESAPAQPAQKSPAEHAQKPSHKIVFIVIAIILLAALGGGAYYWWFFVRNQEKPQAVNTEKNQPPPPQSKADSKVSQPSPENQENKSLRRWKFNSDSDKIAARLAIERYANEFLSTASESELAEAKIVSQDNNPIELKNLEEILSFQLPAAFAENATNEYSFFVRRENGEPKMGAVFKLSFHVTTAALETQEGSLVQNLNLLYLSRVPAETVATFSSSRYKNADIRYFNFPNTSNTSLDYTIIPDRSTDSSYFIVSTSKDSLRAILDYMSEK